MGCEVVNVGTGEETSFNEVVDLLNEKLGTSIRPKRVENPIENYVPRTLADLTKAKEALGYEPTVNLDKGVERLRFEQRKRKHGWSEKEIAERAKGLADELGKFPVMLDIVKERGGGYGVRTVGALRREAGDGKQMVAGTEG